MMSGEASKNQAALKIEIADYVQNIAAIQAVRRQVFQQEQGIEPQLDFDGLDETSEHIVAYFQDRPVGTARIRMSAMICKIERVAVLVEWRRQGVGQAIMHAVIDYLTQKGISEAILHAQVTSQRFYERLGFEQQGVEFIEAGIPHIKMHKSLTLPTPSTQLL